MGPEQRYYQIDPPPPSGDLPGDITWTEVEGHPALDLGNHTQLDVSSFARELLGTDPGGSLRNYVYTPLDFCPPPFPASDLCVGPATKLVFKTNGEIFELGEKTKEEVQKGLNSGVHAYDIDTQQYVAGGSVIPIPSPTQSSGDSISGASDGSRVNIQLPTTNANYAPNFLGIGITAVAGIAGLSIGLKRLRSWWQEKTRLEESNETADDIIRDTNRDDKKKKSLEKS